MWVVESPFWAWALVSVLLGLGFTFFSGAVEAWLVDAMVWAGYDGDLEAVFGRGQMVSGAAMLGGSVAGGVIAQVTSLGVPFLLRVGVLLVMFGIAFRLMFDRGFTPEKGSSPLGAMRHVFVTSLDGGLRNPPVRWVMLAAPFTAGVGIYAFYAMQPYLLELWGDPEAYSIAGLAAAIVAGSQIVGGYLAPRIRALFHRRTSPLILGTSASALVLLLLGFTDAFWVALFLLVVWGMIFAALMPIRQAYLNGMIPSQQRATVLSFDSLMGNTGGVVIQPVLGKSADVYSYSTSYVIGAAIEILAVPLLVLSRREKSPSDVMVGQPEPVPAVAGQASGE
jgi:Major Facilitator Superfamily